MVLLFVPPRGLVFEEARSQLVSSSGFRPICTMSPPKMKGFNTWTFSVKFFIDTRCSQVAGTSYAREIFLTTPNDPLWYCMAAVMFSTSPKFGICQRPLGLSHDHTSFSTRPLGQTPPYELGYPPK